MNIPPPNNLKCEYAQCPLGIDTCLPRFSWNLNHPKRDQTQKAYQIIVSSDHDQILRNVCKEWDSGKVDSEEMVNIEYAGDTLESISRYFFKVRWWDSEGNESPYSETAHFETAFLSAQEWVAGWISMPHPRTFPSIVNTLLAGIDRESPQYYGIYLRKEFETARAVKRARVFVSGIGFYELRLNGQKVGNLLLDPAQTDYNKVALYSAYDVTPYLINGGNAIGIILGNGRHIKAHGYDRPRAILHLQIEYENGENKVLVSDDNWRASHGPLMENGIYFGERYDARKEMPGWDAFSFDDSSWEPVEIVTGPVLASQTMPPIRSTEILKPQKLFSPKPGAFVYDFGQNFTGWARLFVRGPAGTEVKLRFAELLNKEGMLNTSTSGEAENTDFYILKGDGDEVFEPRFTYHGFRYVEMTGFPGIPALENLDAVFFHSDVEKIGNFHCSNPLINAIHRNILWGQLSNLMSVPTDCPQRGERMGWMGDAQLAAEESFYNFDMIGFYIKYLQDIRFAQKEDGSLSDVIPPYWPLYPADPAWGSAYISIAWYCYLFTGDRRILDDHFTTMKKYIDFLSGNSDNNIIKTLGRYSDWCPPGSILPKSTPVELTSTWYFFHDTLVLSEIADVLGKNEDFDQLSGLAESIKTAFNNEFLEGSRYATVNNGPLTRVYTGQTSQTLPLYLDMAPREEKENVLNRLVDAVVRQSDHHVDTGIVGTRYLFDVLTENGFAETAYKVATQRTYPGWGYMIEEGATTLWERWEKLEGGGMNSHNHIMLGSIDAWFYRILAGLSLLEAGWKQVRIKPHILGDLKHATATLQTVRGEFHVSWEKREDTLKLFVSLPVGSQADLYIPVFGDDSSIRENDTLIWAAGKHAGNTEGITSLKAMDDYVKMTAGSGFYEFEIQG